MGDVVTGIPTSYTGGTASDFKNLITQSPSIELERVQREAFRRFGTALDEADPIPPQPWSKTTLDPGANAADKATFYQRVNSGVVSENIKGLLSPKGWEDLMLEKAKFTFTDVTAGVETYDGPCMLKVLLEEVDPTTSVNIELHRQAIEQAKLHAYDNSVTEMIKDIEKHHQAIVSNGSSYEQETYRRHIFAALLSGPNEVFNTHFNAIKSDVDSCYGYHANISPKLLLAAAKTQYTNIDKRNEWAKVDPKDAKIMALSTRFDKLEEQKNEAKKPPTGDSGGNAAPGNEIVPGTRNLKAWRTKFVGKKITRDGQEQNWCPHHVDSGGKWNGLYYNNHDEHTHTEWKAKNKEKFRSRSDGAKSEGTNPGGKTPTAGSMQISDALKNALCTNFCVSEDDLNKIVDSAGHLN